MTNILVVNVILNKRMKDMKTENLRIAAQVLEVFHPAPEKMISVTVSYGYDLGLCRGGYAWYNTQTASAWREVISREVL